MKPQEMEIEIETDQIDRKATHVKLPFSGGWGFCPECGSPIAVMPDAAPQLIGIRTASLDDPSWFKLEMDTWTSDANPWHEMNPELPQFEKYPG